MTRNTPVAADTAPPAITAILARFVSTHPGRGWNDAVEREAVRTFYNWLGCAIGAARHPAADAALAALQMLEPAPQAAVLGRSERLDMASAALLNGITSHTFDFDDTHLKTIIHPAAPVASAILALAEQRGASGRALLDALVIGIDVACRIGNAMYPEHYDRGWHITGSTGMLGAAAGCARLLGLDTQQTGMALGIAASQPIGLREQFGTMTKPFHPGAAARAGMLSALLASKGFTASARALEAPRGFVQVVSNKRAWHEVSDALGERFEISFNTYKPFACGIVIHPGIDACVQLRAQGVQPQQVERIELRVHPLVLELTGKKTPRDGLEAKFSVYHGCAVGLIFGRAGETEFCDELVNRADVMALRSKVHATVDDSIGEAAADVTAVLRDGRSLHVRIGHAIGSLQRPLDDAQLDDKFMSLVEPVLGRAKGTRIGQECRALATLTDMRALTTLCVP
ncbi:MmgE/PrpD family protein [Verminephrobacter eiseniae]|uniref:MmgE/PrpD family protein n=1 Tax=Verminephrobacter eiseniae TaxID=364317 RepID=UPI0022377C8C|nr:MmgE/PrpD family protein [Verminephrobacter eiseniae]MCW5233231.1 MmgE/PrpD family protein [Verminephrobacter eiseniae]MCW5295215.1 MmgE/PrpD family protein [Verminephrobacter eiseniae]MCW8184133.1 MmgE/PrpD family protein [Verminephrobacter eiseniae]MCW8222694.1 MmgE/PrpD family protein [Verminephrobacter eiseniae]MCW8234164.1 MmgE/PrpD family protein [Verminephrobacter eiseniae]